MAWGEEGKKKEGRRRGKETNRKVTEEEQGSQVDLTKKGKDVKKNVRRVS